MQEKDDMLSTLLTQSGLVHEQLTGSMCHAGQGAEADDARED